MRSTHARRAAMIGTAALLLTVPVAALTLAQPAAPAPAPATPASGLPADLVAAIQRDLGLTADQYLDRAQTGQNLVQFADSIRGTFPDSFAGAWLDADGTPMVGLADGPDKAAARTAVEAAGFQVKDQQHNERTLLDQLGQVSDWIRGLPAEQSARVKGASIDLAHNDIAMGVHDIAEDQGQGLQLPDFLGFVRVILGSLGSAQPPTTQPPVTTTTQPPVTTTTKPPVTTTTKPPVTTTTKPPVTTTTKPPQPRADDVMGGSGYDTGDAAQAFCSFGFNGVDGDGNIVNITAGHCDQDRDNPGDVTTRVWDTSHVGRPYVGTFESAVVDGGDYALIQVDESAARHFKNPFVNGYDKDPVAITGTADPVVGAPVCKSGQITGFTCGHITGVDQGMNSGKATVRDSFVTNMCGMQGDSGGAIVTGTKALGITVGIANYECGKDPQLWGDPINSILAANPGLRVTTKN